MSGRLCGALLCAAALLPAAAAAQTETVTEEALDASIESIILDGSVESLQVEQERDGRVELSVSSDVLFEFDEARLTAKARATLDRIAGRIRRGPVRVEGHTDSVGTTAYNLALSRRRAATVRAALAAQLGGGIAISARGFGESRPVEPNTRGGQDNPEGRARNRRVTISFPRG